MTLNLLVSIEQLQEENAILKTEKEQWRRDCKKLSNGIGQWMSAAMGDPKVCDEMKADIELFFDILDKHGAYDEIKNRK